MKTKQIINREELLNGVFLVNKESYDFLLLLGFSLIEEAEEEKNKHINSDFYYNDIFFKKEEFFLIINKNYFKKIDSKDFLTFKHKKYYLINGNHFKTISFLIEQCLSKKGINLLYEQVKLLELFFEISSKYITENKVELSYKYFHKIKELVFIELFSNIHFKEHLKNCENNINYLLKLFYVNIDEKDFIKLIT